MSSAILSWRYGGNLRCPQVTVAGVRTDAPTRAIVLVKAERSTLRLTLNIGLRHVGCGTLRAPCRRMVLSALYEMEPQPAERPSSQW